MHGSYYGGNPYMMNGPYMGMLPPAGYNMAPPQQQQQQQQQQQRLMMRGGGGNGMQSMGSQYAPYGGMQTMSSQYSTFGGGAANTSPATSAATGTSQSAQLARGTSFTGRLKDRQASGMTMQQQQYPPFNNYGSMTSNGFGGYGGYGSFHRGGYMGGAPGANMSNYSSTSTNAGSLYRVNSGLGSQTFSYGPQGFTGGSSGGKAGSQNGSFARQSSLLGFGSAMGVDGSFRGGDSGAGANSFRSVDSTTSGTGAAATTGGGYDFGPAVPAQSSAAPGGGGLQRQDSATSMARTYSISGQFYDYSNTGPGTEAGNGYGPGQRRLSMQPNPQQQQMGNRGGYGGMTQPVAPMMTLNGMNGFMRNNAMAGRGGGGMAPNGAAGGAAGAGAANPNRRTGKTEDTPVAEGQPQPLGRKNSVNNLSRKGSEKRIGMYFKNKESQDDQTEYKRDGDPEVNKREAKKDPTLVNNVKPILLLDRASRNKDLELDGSTVRYQKPGNDEVSKYDMRDVIVVDQVHDVDVLADSLDEVQQNFVMGNNVGMIMADADCKASDPENWFTWRALRSVVKNVFGRMQSSSSAKDFTTSMCLLQDDQVLDLLADPPLPFKSLTVAESPLFGNVAHGMQYLELEDARDFNDTLDMALALAKKKQQRGDEQGIILVTCVLKQVRTSQSTGKKDVIMSSIFASGVGDGVIHYNRILDKNPAEPRALFYSVLHRSVHSSAIFSTSETNAEISTYLTTLDRFRKVETRKPKVGSMRVFASYGKSSVPRVKEELEKAKAGPKKIMLQKHLDKLELMLLDAEEALEDPENCVPKTYV